MHKAAVLALLILGLCASACATRPELTSCPPITMDQQDRNTFGSVAKVFGEQPHYVLRDPDTVDSNGNTVVHLKQIGPTTAPQPGPGEGHRLTLIVQPCTYKVLRILRADLRSRQRLPVIPVSAQPNAR